MYICIYISIKGMSQMGFHRMFPGLTLADYRRGSTGRLNGGRAFCISRITQPCCLFFQGQMWLALVIFQQSCVCNLQFPRDHAVHVAIKSWTNSISKPVYRPSATESHDQVFNEQKQQKQSKAEPFYLHIFSDTSSYELTLALLLMVEDSKRSCRW